MSGRRAKALRLLAGTVLRDHGIKEPAPGQWRRLYRHLKTAWKRRSW